MAYTGLGWRSLDAVEAVASVHAVEDREELYTIAEEAMHPEARRMALLKLGDQEKTAHAAEWDISPIVRRRMVRELDDEALLEKIARNDKDRSVTDSALERLKELRSVCTIRISGEPAPPPKEEDPVPEWKQIQELFTEELRALRRSLPKKSRFFSRIKIEPVKYSEDREVLLLRTSVEERDGSVQYGAAILDLEIGKYFYQESTLAVFSKEERNSRREKTFLLDLNRPGWLLLTGDGETLRTYDIADKKGKILMRGGLFDFASFLEDDRYILCRQRNTVYVIEAETGTVCATKKFQSEYEEMYVIDNNSFALRQGNSSIRCAIEWNTEKMHEKETTAKSDRDIISWF